MAKTIGKNRNITDEATISNAIETNINTTVTVAVASPLRIFFCINNNGSNQAVWVKLQAASVDNIKKGIYIAAKDSWIMPSDNIYTGEISVIAAIDSPDVYVTEY